MAEDTRNRPDFSSEQSSSPARETGNDPLAELARLIGQTDPFNDFSKRGGHKLDSVRNDDRPAPEWLARPASGQHDDTDYEQTPAPQAYAPAHHASQYDPPAHGEGAHDQAYADGAHDDYQGDDRYRVALPSGQYESDSYYADDGHLPPQADEGVIHRRRGGLITVAAVVGLAVVGTAGAFGYRALTWGSSAPANPPIIKADPTPAKTVPAPAPAPTTTASADSKPFQDRIAAPAPERVVPREEQPVSLPTAPPAPATPRATMPQPSAQAPAPLVSPPPPTSASEPKRVKTVTIRQDNSVADSNATASTPPAAQQQRAPATKQSNSGPMAIAPNSEPSSRTKTAARTPAAAAAGGPYVVQVSAQKTEDEARSSYRTLQQKYPTVLGSREASIRRADLGDKGVYYRAQIGPFASAEQANAFCGDLKAAGGQCIVQKN